MINKNEKCATTVNTNDDFSAGLSDTIVFWYSLDLDDEDIANYGIQNVVPKGKLGDEYNEKIGFGYKVCDVVRDLDAQGKYKDWICIDLNAAHRKYYHMDKKTQETQEIYDQAKIILGNFCEDFNVRYSKSKDNVIYYCAGGEVG